MSLAELSGVFGWDPKAWIYHPHLQTFSKYSQVSSLPAHYPFHQLSSLDFFRNEQMLNMCRRKKEMSIYIYVIVHACEDLHVHAFMHQRSSHILVHGKKNRGWGKELQIFIPVDNEQYWVV